MMISLKYTSKKASYSPQPYYPANFEGVDKNPKSLWPPYTSHIRGGFIRFVCRPSFSAMLMFAASLHIIFSDHQVIAYRHEQEFKIESGLAVTQAQHNRLMLSVEKQNEQTNIQRYLNGRHAYYGWKRAKKDKAGHKMGGNTLYMDASDGLAEVKPLIALIADQSAAASKGREKKPARP